MLSQYFQDQLSLGVAQSILATVFALLVLLLIRWQSIHMEREIVVSLIRGFVQIVAVGSILVILLQGPFWTGTLILPLMILFAAMISARRAKGVPGAFQVSLYGIAFGSGLVIILMTWLGVIEQTLASLIPVGSMVIASAMNASALALDRFKAEVESHTGQIEAGLSLGARPRQVIQPYLQNAFQASLIPIINSMRSLGIVWIPGLMAGMILAGVDPIYAAIYQFVLVAILFVSSSLSSLVSSLLVRGHIFSAADQLLLKTEIETPD